MRFPLLAALLLVPLIAAAHPDAGGDAGWRVVAGVAADDVLNVRAGPSASAEIVGALAPGALVTATSETATTGSTLWRRISRGDAPPGWVADRFLAPARFETFEGTILPVAGRCGGFEPGWHARWDAETLTLGAIDAEDRTRPITRIVRADGHLHALIEAGADPANRALLRMEDAACPHMPLDALVWGKGVLIETRDGETRWRVGCCTPAPEAVAPPE